MQELTDSGFIGYSLAAVAISWCTYSASAIFVAVLQLTKMRALVAYPVGLFCILLYALPDDANLQTRLLQ
jgi:hypothetical protein